MSQSIGNGIIVNRGISQPVDCKSLFVQPTTSQPNTQPPATLAQSHSSTNGQRVPDRLVYNPPRREDFPPQSRSWRNALYDIISSVEESNRQHEHGPVVLFKNEKYVCTYDKVSSFAYCVSSEELEPNLIRIFQCNTRLVFTSFLKQNITCC
mmetsp:Transcript_24675/g.59495  ORF Transcript_24675/g.59495 Transcript_24675/m.59495 type:complete len:152 (+) Transcript_24675:82-537(+)